MDVPPSVILHYTTTTSLTLVYTEAYATVMDVPPSVILHYTTTTSLTLVYTEAYATVMDVPPSVILHYTTTTIRDPCLYGSICYCNGCTS